MYYTDIMLYYVLWYNLEHTDIKEGKRLKLDVHTPRVSYYNLQYKL